MPPDQAHPQRLAGLPMPDLNDWLRAATDLDAIYQSELGRSVFSDPEGFVNWAYHRLDRGASLDEIRHLIRQSPEYQAKHPGGPSPPPPSPLPPSPPPPGGGGGFVEHASSRSVRPRLSRQRMAALLPAETGPFIFPDYGTRGIRLTGPRDGVVRPIGMSYWPNVNNHAGRSELFAILSLSDTLTLFSVNKGSGQVQKLRALPFHVTGEGCYWSFREPHTIYVPQGNRLVAYDVVSSQSRDVVAASAPIRQCHSSADGRVHSFTIDGGAGVSRDGAIRVFRPRGAYDECQIDKSGRWLLIKEGDGNRIVDLDTGNEFVISNAAGAVGHSDMGWGYVIGEDDQTDPGGVFRLWTFTPNGPVNGGQMYFTDWTGMSRYVSHCNAAPAPRERHLVLFSSSHGADAPRANELVVARLDGSLECRAICPNLTDLSAPGGGEEYWRKTRANLDPPGEFACFTGNMGTDRMDAFLVQL
jgi:hypothetical protein